jgi:2-keto-4-pentenoate hydratase/2-oxohepta-3-ene-1,7-dioic acid hydratase in catechol pathway
MRLVRVKTSDKVSIGVVKNNDVFDVSSLLKGLHCTNRLIEDWSTWKPVLEQAALGLEATPKVGRQDEVPLGAPVPNPGKVICIGLNYADHAAETGAAIPTEPVVFNKFPEAIIGPEDKICLPSISSQVDYEAELVVVIGQTLKNCREEEAMAGVFGYTCGHDVSARDWQKGRPGGQWLLGKTFDTFGPIGPVLVTRDEIPDPHDLRVQFRLNGTTRQDSSTSQLIFRIPKLVAHLSQFTTLRPGDLIFTGTPPGVGAARDPQMFLKPGDRAEVEIDNLGVLANAVVAAEAS